VENLPRGKIREPVTVYWAEDTTMNRSLRTAFVLLAATFAAPLSGCVVRAQVEPLVRYEGTPVTDSLTYNSNLPLRIHSANGNVTVVPGGSDKVEVVFSPFVMGEQGQEEAARREMDTRLETFFGGTGELLVEVTQLEGASGGLGADIEVRLPASFNGTFEVWQDNGGIDIDLSGTSAASTIVDSDNGSVTVEGARGRLDVYTDNGSVDMDVDAWSAENGEVRTGNGDITFALPANVNGKMTASSGSEVIEQNIPASTWATAGQSPARSYTMGTGVGGQVDIVTEGLGDITIIAK
jgi:hypothetical protein